MCGILGLINNHTIISKREERLMERALADISYRGPDNQSIWKNEKSLLGHLRLSIIDLSNSANQPFHDLENKIHLVFNGEIYNYKEIRNDLARKGIIFRTNSDTETIIELYKLYGLSFVNYMRGMFAIAIYDSLKNQLILTRDRLGKKPLFYFIDDEKIIFSSEAKSFKLFGSSDINIDSLISYFLFQYISAPATIFKNVFSLQPGEIININLNTWETEKYFYWSSKEYIKENKNVFDINTLENLISDAVQYRLVSDVDVGLLLSGGLDSTLIACYIKECSDNKKVKAFNVKFRDKKYDESEYSRIVAQSLGFELISVVGDTITEDIFLKCLSHCDQPLGDPAIIPTYMISEQISKFLKVVISGEGADELFMGYDYYKYEKVINLIKFINIFASPLIKSRAVHNFLNSKLLNRLRKISETKFDIGTARWRTVFSIEEINLLLDQYKNTKNEFSVYSKVDSLLQSMNKKIEPECILNIELIDWRPSDLLMKIDRMTMAHSLEARTPFLDHILVEYIVNIDPKFLGTFLTSKKPLRKLLLNKLPSDVGREISKRKKHGFEVPVDKWMKTDLRKLTDKYFSKSYLKQIEFLDATYIQKIWQDYLRLRNAHIYSRQIWVLFTFLAWYDLHFSKNSN